MTYLLDTNVVLWAMDGDPRLGTRTVARLQKADGGRYVSAASVWEIAIKVALGKLDAPDDLLATLVESGFTLIDMTPLHALAAGRLPLHHRDPFDRMLVAQARVEGLTLVTSDGALAAYDVPVIDARL